MQTPRLKISGISLSRNQRKLLLISNQLFVPFEGSKTKAFTHGIRIIVGQPVKSWVFCGIFFIKYGF
jgi:hypothetical protein